MTFDRGVRSISALSVATSLSAISTCVVVSVVVGQIDGYELDGINFLVDGHRNVVGDGLVDIVVDGVCVVVVVEEVVEGVDRCASRQQLPT